ncbi:type-F conjugative transfer system pilin assembly protein TrbC [Candidatus Protochlamydia phocaeensis]|uniref:type-F conjugative transfer system pilin assembly protein TrbC n=1 Tax=Candidatus Protochlamydia phocaeensis TaxID=1414722 RepID=UPI0008386342|nr:type-F conjugative transfer system pilin assembly protein TrbC [Candidatus Protochlamydia phocaeensis]
MQSIISVLLSILLFSSCLAEEIKFQVSKSFSESLFESFQLPIKDPSWDQPALQGSDQEVQDWLKQQLREKKQELGLTPNRSPSHEISRGQCQKCLAAKPNEDIEFPLVVFMSFSMPEAVWLALGQEIEKLNGIMVLRGVPNNSFKELANRLLKLKQNGLNATIQIHPQLFEQYNIDQVPCFLVRDKESLDKVFGNISLKFALELMAKKGETALAKELKDKLL